MALTVIGAGLGRTGTLSLKLALEALGVGRCFHMVELIENQELLGDWDRAGQGLPVNWDKIFAGYGATVDWPSCNYYRALAAHYPQAKVLLTLRDANKWFDSTQATIFRNIEQMTADPANPFGRMIKNTIMSMFENRMHERAHCIAVYEGHNAEVRRAIPKDRLLEFDVAEGWTPLCAFLGRARPATLFPRVNSTEEFQRKFASRAEA